MFGWFWALLSSLGFGSKEARVLILGAPLLALPAPAAPASTTPRCLVTARARLPARAGQRGQDDAALPAQVGQDQQLHPDPARQHRGFRALRPEPQEHADRADAADPTFCTGARRSVVQGVRPRRPRGGAEALGGLHDGGRRRGLCRRQQRRRTPRRGQRRTPSPPSHSRHLPTAVQMPAGASSAVDTTCLRIGRSCTRWWGRRASRPPPSSSCATRWTYPCGPSPSLGIECGMLSSMVAQTAKPLAEMEEALGAWPTTSSRAVTQDACPPPRHECRARTRVPGVCVRS